jgi:hypothetical protein
LASPHETRVALESHVHVSSNLAYAVAPILSLPRVGDPGVALAVNRHALAARARLEGLDLAWIARWEARDRVADGVGDPDPILLIDRQMERPVQFAVAILARLAGGSLAEELGLAGVPLGQIDDFVLAKIERPDVSARRDARKSSFPPSCRPKPCRPAPRRSRNPVLRRRRR